MLEDTFYIPVGSFYSSRDGGKEFARKLRFIKVGDIVLHSLSGLYFYCENKKHERWMNMNSFYSIAPTDVVDKSYFLKNTR